MYNLLFSFPLWEHYKGVKRFTYFQKRFTFVNTFKSKKSTSLQGLVGHDFNIISFPYSSPSILKYSNARLALSRF